MEAYGTGVNGVFVFVEIADVLRNAILKVEVAAFIDALIDKLDENSGIQEGQLSQTLGQQFEFKFSGCLKNLRVWREGDAGAGALGFPNDLHLGGGDATRKFHFVNFSFTADFHLEPFRDRVDAFCTHSM